MSGEIEVRRGRPSLYKPEYARQAQKLCEFGATDVDLADLFDVCPRTIQNWRLDYPEFAEATKIGKGHFDDRVERSMGELSVGYTYTEQQAVKVKVAKDKEEVQVVDVTKVIPPNGQVGQWWLQNRRPDRWKNKVDVAHSGRIEGERTTPDEARELIRRHQAKEGATKH